MIKGYEKFRVPDENKGEPIVVEVNWNPYDKTVTDCKLIRIILPGGHTAVVKKEHLNAILFAIGNEEEQRKMIPQVTRRSKWYETVVSVKATKDIKKGQELTFPIKLTLPTIEAEAIAEVKREVLKSGYELHKKN